MKKLQLLIFVCGLILLIPLVCICNAANAAQISPQYINKLMPIARDYKMNEAELIDVVNILVGCGIGEERISNVITDGYSSYAKLEIILKNDEYQQLKTKKPYLHIKFDKTNNQKYIDTIDFYNGDGEFCLYYAPEPNKPPRMQKPLVDCILKKTLVHRIINDFETAVATNGNIYPVCSKLYLNSFNYGKTLKIIFNGHFVKKVELFGQEMEYQECGFNVYLNEYGSPGEPWKDVITAAKASKSLTQKEIPAWLDAYDKLMQSEIYANS